MTVNTTGPRRFASVRHLVTSLALPRSPVSRHDNCLTTKPRRFVSASHLATGLALCHAPVEASDCHSWLQDVQVRGVHSEPQGMRPAPQDASWSHHVFCLVSAWSPHGLLTVTSWGDCKRLISAGNIVGHNSATERIYHVRKTVVKRIWHTGNFP